MLLYGCSIDASYSGTCVLFAVYITFFRGCISRSNTQKYEEALCISQDLYQ